MYTIKQTPDDFIVEEQISFLDRLEKDPLKLKGFVYYRLTKKNMTTLHALSRIASALFIEDRQIGFCGLKDKNATTSQYISLPNFGTKTAPPRVTTLTINNCKLEFVGSADTGLFLGNLSANKFTIRVEETQTYTITTPTHMINYFGEQRFSQNNAQIGKLLVKRKFLDAVNLILQESAERADKTTNDVKDHIAQKPNDAVGALRKLNPQHIKLYMHALQSLLWNEVASQLVTQQTTDLVTHYIDEQLAVAIPSSTKLPTNVSIPLIGFDYEEDEQTPEVKKAIAQALKKHNLSLRDFIVKEFPELTKSGGKRDLITPINELQVSEKTEHSATFAFTLEKGAYATIALRHILVPLPKVVKSE